MFPFLSILPNYYYKRKHTFFVYITTLKWKRGRKSLPTSIIKRVTTYLPQNLKNRVNYLNKFLKIMALMLMCLVIKESNNVQQDSKNKI